MTPRPFVYILRCRDGSLYTGAAKDLARRLAQHRAGTASKYTRSRRPVELAWSRRVTTWRRALQIERLIKQLPRAGKLALLSGAASFMEPGPRTGSARPGRTPRSRRS